MTAELRALVASIESDEAFQLLDEHKKEFAGTEWMPANFFQRKRIVYILQRMEALYKSFETVDFAGMPGEAQMVKTRYRMWLDLKMAKRWQVKDHMRFFKHVNAILQGARNILERLRRLAVTGQITRGLKPQKTKKTPTELLD